MQERVSPINLIRHVMRGMAHGLTTGKQILSTGWKPVLVPVLQPVLGD